MYISFPSGMVIGMCFVSDTTSLCPSVGSRNVPVAPVSAKPMLGLFTKLTTCLEVRHDGVGFKKDVWYGKYVFIVRILLFFPSLMSHSW